MSKNYYTLRVISIIMLGVVTVGAILEAAHDNNIFHVLFFGVIGAIEVLSI